VKRSHIRGLMPGGDISGGVVFFFVRNPSESCNCPIGVEEIGELGGLFRLETCNWAQSLGGPCVGAFKEGRIAIYPIHESCIRFR